MIQSDREISYYHYPFIGNLPSGGDECADELNNYNYCKKAMQNNNVCKCLLRAYSRIGTQLKCDRISE